MHLGLCLWLVKRLQRKGRYEVRKNLTTGDTGGHGGRSVFFFVGAACSFAARGKQVLRFAKDDKL